MSAPVPSSELAKIKCAACGEEFGCGANASCESGALDCWCAGVQISDLALEQMQARYQGCLCPNCLTSFSADERA